MNRAGERIILVVSQINQAIAPVIIVDAEIWRRVDRDTGIHVRQVRAIVDAGKIWTIHRRRLFEAIAIE
jgi:hypothetical protein